MPGLIVALVAALAAGLLSTVPATAAPASMPLLVDFGTATTTPVAGYVLDYGQQYGVRTGPHQGSGNTFGWVRDGTVTPLDLIGRGRLRTGTGTTDPKLNTLVHMQTEAAVRGAWEVEVSNGTYTVTVGVGDSYPVYDSTHAVTVEGQTAVAPYVPNATTRLKSGTVTVQVADGRLTVRPQGGTNVKLTHLTIGGGVTPPPPPTPTFPFKVDFGAQTSTPVSGNVLDYGQAYGTRATGVYGWVGQGTSTPLNAVGRGVQRTATGLADARQANFVAMQAGATSTMADWRMTVPNGSYQVSVGTGDASNVFDSTHAITVQGVVAIAPYVPTSTTKFRIATVGVTVSTGVLVVTASAGSNTKIDYLEIAQGAAPPPPPPPTGFPTKVDFGTTTSPMPAGYVRDTGAAYGARTGGYNYGWVTMAGSTPLNLTLNSRLRSSTVTTDPRLLSMIHMQYSGATTTGNSTPGAWEVAVPNGSYLVTVAVGDADASYNSSHSIRAESTQMISGFVPTSTDRIRTATAVVSVTDGKLTLSPIGGTNTKIDYVDLEAVSGSRPRVAAVSPAANATGVVRDTSITTELVLPGGAINPNTVTTSTVRLVTVATGAAVPASVNTSGGGDVLVLTANQTLQASTQYRYEITDGVKDVAGNSFIPFQSVFTTGTLVSGTGINGVAFGKEDTVATGQQFTSTTFGPDGKLYAATLNGYIYRYSVAANGVLSAPQQISTIRTLNNGQNRTIIGLTFDPASTATNLILWATDNYMYIGSADVPDWSSKLVRLTGANLQTGQTVLTDLPRSAHDHEANSIAFGPDGALYLSMGSNTGMGYPDGAWANRPEVTLSGAVLRLNTAALPATLPLNVRTSEGGGSYSPYGAAAPLTIYATGIRNAYDLVWHSNGQLYAPTNGSAAGGNLPPVANPLPASCSTTRIDVGTSGPYTYTGQTFAAVIGNPVAQTDFIHRVVQGGYYGHPNPARCEYISYGGNPTSGTDGWQDTAYPVGVQPDRNYRAGNVFDAGLHASANGTIEYASNVFGDLLQGKLLIVRYSASKDIIVADPTGPNGGINSVVAGVTGFTGFNEPLDITEKPDGSGILYVTELGGTSITLLRPQVG